ncbi:hypothetical protein BDB01DRAFT_838886 [Pilobolus umbonatus]|nr:hypothetical protein BDB01DRAFT_838886 [Pilobolus umbonatus]
MIYILHIKAMKVVEIYMRVLIIFICLYYSIVSSTVDEICLIPTEEYVVHNIEEEDKEEDKEVNEKGDDEEYTEDESSDYEESSTRKERALNKIELLLHHMHLKSSQVSTLQELEDTFQVLEDAKMKINNPTVKMTQLKPPTVNTNRKGRKNKRGVKSGVERMKIAVERFDGRQKMEMKMKMK